MATETDKVNTGALATLVAVGAFAMIAISLSLVALVRDEVSNELSIKDAAQGDSYESLRTAQLTKLQSGKPIDNVMADVVREFSANPSAATPPGTAPAAAAGGAAAGGAAAGGAAAGGAAAGDGAAAGGAAGSAATDVDLAPKPNRQKDGKLPPAGGAPVPAPKPPEHEH